MVGGTRPEVSPAMVRDHLHQALGIAAVAVSVHRHVPEDFIVRFRRLEDLDLVLSTPNAEGMPFSLIWRRWRRTSRASAGSFKFRVLVGMKGIPSHARSASTVQLILGSSCAKVEVAPVAVDDDDERQFFVAAWCVHPQLIPDGKIMAVPEPQPPHVVQPPLFLREEEPIISELPALRYLVRLRIIEFQDWRSPITSSDDGPGDDDDDSGDSCHYNGYWPGVDDRGRSSSWPTTVRVAGEGDPGVGSGWGPTFRTRAASRCWWAPRRMSQEKRHTRLSFWPSQRREMRVMHYGQPAGESTPLLPWRRRIGGSVGVPLWQIYR
uniref:DUF4283 domain-containing protein n=1 Tax=Setaria viridis TaxID=4556 RepID=A0A4U6U0J8_SETVI|nr:hypothetical protein SEVIR_7G314200v2 [Setaria viridis]